MRCQFIKTNNEQCEANAIIGSSYCFSHNPESEEAKKEAVKNGGLAPKPRKEMKSLEPLLIRNVDDILKIIEDTINRIRTEPMTHQKANCIGYLANVALKALEVDKLEEKLSLINGVVIEREAKQ